MLTDLGFARFYLSASKIGLLVEKLETGLDGFREGRNWLREGSQGTERQGLGGSVSPDLDPDLDLDLKWYSGLGSHTWAG